MCEFVVTVTNQVYGADHRDIKTRYKKVGSLSEMENSIISPQRSGRMLARHGNRAYMSHRYQ